MILKDQNILFFTRTMKLGGTENVILQLCEIFKPLVNKIVVCSCGGVNERKLQEMGIRHYTIPDIENKSLKTILNVSKEIKKIVSNEHINVIHTHHRMAAFYVRLLGLYNYCKFINTSHNTFANKRFFTRYAYKKAHLIACGEMVKKNLERVYGLNNVTVIHNAVKQFDDKIVIDKEINKDKQAGKYLIGNVGRLSKQKGMEYYIKAIPDVLKVHPEAHFYIIGSGENEKILKEMAKELPVTFLGYRTDVQNLMSQMDIIVLSSIWEGLPLTPIEAFSVGKTIVATGVDGTLEIVKDGWNGLLIEKENSSAISEKIIWMIDNPKERERMERNGRETFEKDFSFETLSDKYIQFYLDLKQEFL